MKVSLASRSANSCQNVQLSIASRASLPPAVSRLRTRAASGASPVQEAPRDGWFTRTDSFQSIMEPHRYRADQLESSLKVRPVMEVPATRDEAVVLMERLQHETAAAGAVAGVNVVPFTGGSGPALLAYLLNSVFDGAVVACIGSAAHIPAEQLQHAQYVADLLGIELVEVDDQFWSQVELPHALGADAEALCHSLAGDSCEAAGITVFCGATADDVTMLCSEEPCLVDIKAPLAGLSRAAVNALCMAIGLPDWKTHELPAASLSAVQAVAA